MAACSDPGIVFYTADDDEEKQEMNEEEAAEAEELMNKSNQEYLQQQQAQQQQLAKNTAANAIIPLNVSGPAVIGEDGREEVDSAGSLGSTILDLHGNKSMITPYLSEKRSPEEPLDPLESQTTSKPTQPPPQEDIKSPHEYPSQYSFLSSSYPTHLSNQILFLRSQTDQHHQSTHSFRFLEEIQSQFPTNDLLATEFAFSTICHGCRYEQ